MEEKESIEASLYRTILSWNYYDLWTKMSVGKPFGFVEGYKDLPEVFTDAQEYIAGFEPLMLEEIAAVMVRGLEQTQIVAPVKCVTGPVEEEDGFLIIQFLLETPRASDFKTHDLVLLTTEDPNEQESSEALNALGMMENRINDNSLVLRFYLHPEVFSENQKPEQLRVGTISSRLRQAHSGWWLTRVTGLSTSLREWSALHSIGRIAFKNVIFSAQPQVLDESLKRIPEALDAVLSQTYNESQRRALSSGLKGQQIVLIQGPPGTGKTRTLLGLLSVILYALPAGSIGIKLIRPRQTQDMALKDIRDLWLSDLLKQDTRDLVAPWERGDFGSDFGMAIEESIFMVKKNNEPTARILVCAPSNSALDEIVLRLMNGLKDRKGQTFKPRVVRVGLSVHHSVQSVSLDALLSQRMSQMSSYGKAQQTVEHMKRSIIEDAHIVCSTLSFSGSSLLKQLPRPFDVVVIDEAAQAVEPSTLIPFSSGAKQVYLIGDPVQLPATVISRDAILHKYDKSMFKRLQAAGYPVNMLDTQYRMHPNISAYPSSEFYQNKLQDGPGVVTQNTRPWHAHKVFGPFAFFDVSGYESLLENSSSLENAAEAEMILCLITTMLTEFPQLTPSKFAVISPYLAQVQRLRHQCISMWGPDRAKRPDINTIDGFQGREKEIVLFSAVRTTRGGQVGFVADERRINVGLTRARCSLLVIGNATALNKSSRWKNLIRHSRLTRSYFEPSKPYSEWILKAMHGVIKAKGQEAKGKAQRDAQQRHQPDAGGLYSDDEAVGPRGSKRSAYSLPVDDRDNKAPSTKARR